MNVGNRPGDFVTAPTAGKSRCNGEWSPLHTTRLLLLPLPSGAHLAVPSASLTNKPHNSAGEVKLGDPAQLIVCDIYAVRASNNAQLWDGWQGGKQGFCNARGTWSLAQVAAFGSTLACKADSPSDCTCARGVGPCQPASNKQ